MAAGISNRRSRRPQTPLAGRARSPARGERRGPAQAFKDGGGAESGTAIVRRPDSPSPAAPAQQRRGRRGWPRWVRAPRGHGQGGPARAPTPSPRRPWRQRARRAPAACPERPPGAGPGGASPRAPTPQRWEAPPCAPGIAVRRFPCARPERPLLGAAGLFCSGFFFGCFLFWGYIYILSFLPTPSHLPTRLAVGLC